MSKESSDELLRLHRALLDGDTIAPLLLAEKLLPLLRARLARFSAKLTDPQIVESAIGHSVATYLGEPEAYDPTGRSLVNYLAMDVEGDVKNELGKRQREIASDEVVEDRLVEVGLRSRNSPVEEEALDALDPFDVPTAAVKAARRGLAQLSAHDRELAQLVADDVRSYAVWAEVLGITHLPLDDQVREVKRQKDRIKKKLERIGDKSG